MQIARKASLGLALFGLVAGLALISKPASAQDSFSAGNDPIVYTGVPFTSDLTVINPTFVSLTVTDATVEFTKTPAGFNQSADFTSTFLGSFKTDPLSINTAPVTEETFTDAAPLGDYKFVFDVTYYLDHDPGTLYTATSTSNVDVLEASATPEPSQTIALMLGALGVGSLILVRRKSLRA